MDASFQVWNESQILEVFGPFTHRSNTSIGRDWYRIAGNLPRGTDFTFGLNLFDDSEVDKQSKMLSDAFFGSGVRFTKDVNLKYVQVGNEPNFYFDNAAQYVSRWLPLAKTVIRNIRLGCRGCPTFWVGSEVVGDFSAGDFSLTGALEAGILDDHSIYKDTGILEEHHYSGALQIGAIPGGPPPGTLMNKESVRGNLSSRYEGMLNAESYGKTYWLVI